MFRIIHSADWQLGARFSQFGAEAEQLRSARLTTLQKTLALAVSKQADAFLLLDDVLANTDPVRQGRILDVLGAQADRLQILILTCHPDRYRGIGQSLSVIPHHD